MINTKRKTLVWDVWQDAQPENKRWVRTISAGGLESTYWYESRRLFVPDKSMYIYFTPLFWRYEE